RRPGSTPAVLLRSPALRLRISEAGQAPAPRDYSRPAPAPGGRHANRRPGTELSGRVSGRARQSFSRSRGRQAPVAADGVAERVPAQEASRLPPSAAGPQGDAARPLSSQGDREARRRRSGVAGYG